MGYWFLFILPFFGVCVCVGSMKHIKLFLPGLSPGPSVRTCKLILGLKDLISLLYLQACNHFTEEASLRRGMRRRDSPQPSFTII